MSLMSHVIIKLELYDAIKLNRKPTKAGRKTIPLHPRQRIWDLWHDSSQESTLTTNIAKL